MPVQESRKPNHVPFKLFIHVLLYSKIKCRHHHCLVGVIPKWNRFWRKEESPSLQRCTPCSKYLEGLINVQHELNHETALCEFAEKIVSQSFAALCEILLTLLS